MAFIGRYGIAIAWALFALLALLAFGALGRAVWASYHPNAPQAPMMQRMFMVALPAAFGAGALAVFLSIARRRVVGRQRARWLAGFLAVIGIGTVGALASAPRVPSHFMQTAGGTTYRVPSTHTMIPRDLDSGVSLSLCLETGRGTYESGERCGSSGVSLGRGDMLSARARLDLRAIGIDPDALAGAGEDGAAAAGPDEIAERARTAGWTAEPIEGGLAIFNDRQRHLLGFADPTDAGGTPGLLRAADCDLRYEACRISVRRKEDVLSFERSGDVPDDLAPFIAIEQRLVSQLEGWRVGDGPSPAAEETPT